MVHISVKGVCAMALRKAAIYVRLSKADRRGVVSESIKNQKQLLLQYYYQREELWQFPLMLYEDDGYSGLDTERPAWQSLMRCVENGMIGVVLVKDLSRISRNQLYLSRVCELIFPQYSVRLISPGDSYDSSAPCQNILAVRFKSLFYSYYSQDLSRKVKTALEAKKRQGEYASAKPPFGYRKEGKNWNIHPKEAAMVREMFVLAAMGRHSAQIARCLQGREGEYRIYPVKVWRILQNPVYCGIHVWHRYENNRNIGQVGKLLPKEEWRMESGRHPALIPESLFEKVQVRLHYGNRS